MSKLKFCEYFLGLSYILGGIIIILVPSLFIYNQNSNLTESSCLINDIHIDERCICWYITDINKNHNSTILEYNKNKYNYKINSTHDCIYNENNYYKWGDKLKRKYYVLIVLIPIGLIFIILGFYLIISVYRKNRNNNDFIEMTA